MPGRIPTGRHDTRPKQSYNPLTKTVLEIEKAIEQLPEDDQRKLAEWFEDHRLVVESSAVLAEYYDDEDGGGSHWVKPRWKPTAIDTEMSVEALRRFYTACHPAERRWKERGV